MGLENRILVHNTIYVDIEFGNNQTAEQNNPAKPFQTIGEALKVAKKNCPSKKNIWILNVSSGNYRENVKVPRWVDLIGVNSLTIIKKLRLKGFNNITNLTINSTNKTSIKAKSNNVTFNNIKVNSVWKNVSTAGPAVLLKNKETLFNNSFININARNINGDITGIFNTSELNVTNTNAILNVTGNGNNVFLYKILKKFDESTLQISGGRSGLFIDGTASRVALHNLIEVDYESLIIANKMNLEAPNTKGQVIFNLLEGLATLAMSNSFISYGTTPSPNITITLGIPSSLGSPSIKFVNNAFSDVVLPPLTGSFRTAVEFATDNTGSLRMSGGLFGNFKNITTNYRILPEDYTLNVTTPGITITLPTPSEFAGGVVPAGKLLMIKNNSNNSIFVEEPISFPVKLIIPPDGAFILQSNNTNLWVLVGVKS